MDKIPETLFNELKEDAANYYKSKSEKKTKPKNTISNTPNKIFKSSNKINKIKMNNMMNALLDSDEEDEDYVPDEDLKGKDK